MVIENKNQCGICGTMRNLMFSETIVKGIPIKLCWKCHLNIGIIKTKPTLQETTDEKTKALYLSSVQSTKF